MPQKRAKGRPLQFWVQLVNIDSSLCLFPRSLLETALKTSLPFQFTKLPMQKLFVKPDFTLQGILGGGRKQIIPHIQQISRDYIDPFGNVNFGSERLVGHRVYTDVLNLKTRKSLDGFLEDHPNFSIFPTTKEWANLVKRYNDAGVKSSLIKYMKIHFPPNKVPETPPKPFIAIQEINKEFIWDKILDFKERAKQLLEKNAEESELAWLNKELENVSPWLMTYRGYLSRGVREQRIPKATPEQMMGAERIDDLVPMIGYRIYGYLAFCCFELLHDIKARRISVFVCESCTTLQNKPPTSKRKYCLKSQNRKCFLGRNAEAQRKLQIKQK